VGWQSLSVGSSPVGMHSLLTQGGLSIQSDFSWTVCDSMSATVSDTSGMCWAIKMISLLSAHIHSSFARYTLPHMLLMLATAVVLLSCRSSDTPEASFRKVFATSIAARSSRQLMCILCSWHCPCNSSHRLLPAY